MSSKANFITFSVLIFLSLLLASYTKQNPEIAKIGSRVTLILITPLSESFSKLQNYFSDYINDYLLLFRANQQNKLLSERINFLLAENNRFQESQIENQRLRQILKFSVLNQYQGIVADVVGYLGRAQQQAIFINRGSDAGVFIGQVVVDGFALVGQVIDLTKNSAKILLISDPLSGVDSLNQETRVRGIVNGLKSDYLAWNYVPKEEQVAIGNRIITSGADQLYPKGLLIGVVIKINKDQSGMFQDIKIKPATNLDRLETVYLLKPNEH